MNLKRSLENLYRGPGVWALPAIRSKDDPTYTVPVDADNPLPVTMVSGNAGGGPTTDPDSNREATQQQVLAAVQALAPLLGNTDNLETLASTNRDLLQQLNGYTDGLESLLTTLGTNTDGIEELLSALGVKDDNVLSKLEALRALLADTLSTRAALPATNSTQSLTVSVDVVGLTVPDGSTHATVYVVSGAVRVAFAGDAPGATTPLADAGSSIDLSGAEIAGLRLVRDGAANAQVYVHYRTVA